MTFNVAASFGATFVFIFFLCPTLHFLRLFYLRMPKIQHGIEMPELSVIMRVHHTPHRPGLSKEKTMDFIIAGLVAVLLSGYLACALWYPDKF